MLQSIHTFMVCCWFKTICRN